MIIPGSRSRYCFYFSIKHILHKVKILHLVLLLQPLTLMELASTGAQSQMTSGKRSIIWRDLHKLDILNEQQSPMLDIKVFDKIHKCTLMLWSAMHHVTADWWSADLLLPGLVGNSLPHGTVAASASTDTWVLQWVMSVWENNEDQQWALQMRGWELHTVEEKKKKKRRLSQKHRLSADPFSICLDLHVALCLYTFSDWVLQGIYLCTVLRGWLWAKSEMIYFPGWGS